MGANLTVDVKKAEERANTCNSAAKQIASNHTELINKLAKVANSSDSQALKNQVNELKTSGQIKADICSGAVKTTAKVIEEAVEAVKKFDV